MTDSGHPRPEQQPLPWQERAGGEGSGAVHNGPGRASLVFGIVLVAINLAQTLTAPLLPLLLRATSTGLGAYSAVAAAFGVVELVIAVIALVLGIVGLRRPDAPKAAAGAGTALGAASAVVVIASLIETTALSLLG